MAEKVLNNPLTGEEIILALSDRIATSLRRDCFLNPHTAYDYYEATITIAIKMNDAGLREVEVTQVIEDTFGDEPEEGVESIEGELVIVPKPPNEERVATGQPVPVLTKDADGRVVTKHLKYARTKVPGAKSVANTDSLPTTAAKKSAARKAVEQASISTRKEVI